MAVSSLRASLARSSNQALLKAARLEPPILSKLFSEVKLVDGEAGAAPPITVDEAKALLQKLNR
jgi:hypothetical protein